MFCNSRPVQMACKSHLSIKTTAILVIMIALFGINITSATVATEAEMEQVCRNWLTQLIMEKGTWGGSDSPEIATVREISSEDGIVLARYYTIQPRGFVVVPVLKEMQPIKGYSDQSTLDENQEGGFLQLLKEILSERANLYESRWGSLNAAQSGDDPGIFGRGQRITWETYTLPRDKFMSRGLVHKQPLVEAGPLLTSNWHQGSPYNNDCPVDDSGKCYVGCTATAMSQILNFWQWPPSGQGNNSYYWSENTCEWGVPAQVLGADFSDAYDWANMSDSCDLGCSPQEEQAVAELCYEVGVSLNMLYGSCGSGAWPSPYAYHTYFMYNPDIIFENRYAYDLEDWFSLIKNEIDSARPIQYGVYRHSIVCDGYRDHGNGMYEYHMNYGWNNEFTAWFVFDSLYCYWMPDSLCPAAEDHLYAKIKPQVEPIIEIDKFSIISDEDNDGHADIGEAIDLSVDIINRGWDAQNIAGELTSTDSFISVPVATASYDALIPWGGWSSSALPYSISIDAGCPDPHVAVLELSFTGNGGYTGVDSILLFIGDTPGYADDIESGQTMWQSSSMTIGYADEWHPEAFRKHSETFSWKIGGAGSDNYGNLLDACLVTPPFLLPNAAVLTFWHWIDAECWEFGEAWDGGIVMISIDDGPWLQITPNEGYEYFIVDNPQSPFEGGTGCYSGYHDWNQAEYDLSDYSGVARLMFRFGSDFGATEEGWYIDDIVVQPSYLCGDANSDQTVNVGDAVYIIQYIFKGGPAPDPLEAGDANCDGGTDVADAVYLINYVFKGGPEPCCP